MVRAGAISGRVLDTNGNPFPGLTGTVRLLRYRYDEYGKRTLAAVPGVEYDPGRTSTVRMDDRGGYRFYGLQEGEYVVQASGGQNYYYYPGSPNEIDALPIRLETGGEVQLSTLTLPAALPMRDVRFLISDPNGKPLATDVSRRSTVFIRDGEQSVLASVTFGRFENVPDRVPAVLEQVLGLPSGHHEFLVGLARLDLPSQLYYGKVSVNVADSNLDQELHLTRGAHVSGTLSFSDGVGQRERPMGLFCKLDSDSRYVQSALATSERGGCIGAEFSPGHYRLELAGMPRDAYVASAKIGDKDVLADGIPLTGDIELNIAIRSPGATLSGIVSDARGEKLADAVVALVPDGALRAAGPLYRSIISDVNGNYEIRGIAPGSYHMFAWTDLEGAAYRNAEFMKGFDGKGQAVKIERADHAAVNLNVLN
jgi:hypothetical protein